VDSEQVPSEAPSSLPSVTSSPSAIWQCCFEHLRDRCSQLFCEQTAEYRSVIWPRIGSFSWYPCSLQMLLLTVDSEQVPSEAPSSLPRVTASPSAIWQCCLEHLRDRWSVLYCDQAAEYCSVICASLGPISALSGSLRSAPTTARTGALICSPLPDSGE
jgi:hypothetical protein